MRATEEKYRMFHNRLEKKFRHLDKQARRQGITCYRLYDHDLPEFPLCIELYEGRLYVAEYKRRHGLSDEAHEQWMSGTLDVACAVTGIPREQVFSKLRQRKAGRPGQYRKYAESGEQFPVQENGLRFLINLSDYLDTGLFLDHRITRQLVREQSAGKKVLNLFAYTGSFSVYAAAGGAAEVVTVDMSNTYLSWAARNMALNGFDNPQAYRFERADVLAYLKQVPETGYDIIVMDPPTFSNSKMMEGILDIQRDHVQLISDCLRALKPGGLLYFSTNARTFEMDKENIPASEIKDITRATTPFDFEGRLFRWCYRILK